MIKTVLVTGASGVLGSQIALQSAVNGCKVFGFCLNDQEVRFARQKMARFIEQYEAESVDHVATADVQKACEGIEFVTDLKEAAEQADLIIEAIVENRDIKAKFFRDLSQLNLQEHTIITTNTSSLQPSSLMESTGRPDRFLALHFLNEIWRHNVAEVMPTSKTDPKSTQAVIEFSKSIRMIPVLIRKEQPGYIMNTLYIPYLFGALMLWSQGRGTPWEIDQAWMKASGTWIGPFANMDANGFGVVANIFEATLIKPDMPEIDRLRLSYVPRFLKDMIATNRSGKMQDKEGFYHYQNTPEFREEGFLNDTPDISFADFGQQKGDEKTDRAISLFTPVLFGLLEGALTLYVNEIATPKDIDQVWSISSHRGWGVFETIRKIGTEQVYEVFKRHYESHNKSGELQQKILAALRDGQFEELPDQH